MTFVTNLTVIAATEITLKLTDTGTNLLKIAGTPSA
jgi:hypothetical protein